MRPNLKFVLILYYLKLSCCRTLLQIFADFEWFFMYENLIWCGENRNRETCGYVLTFMVIFFVTSWRKRQNFEIIHGRLRYSGSKPNLVSDNQRSWLAKSVTKSGVGKVENVTAVVSWSRINPHPGNRPQQEEKTNSRSKLSLETGSNKRPQV